METQNIIYIGRSIKIRERINPERTDLPRFVDEPVAIFTNNVRQEIPSHDLFNSKLRERNDLPYKVDEISGYFRYLLLNADDSRCSIGYRREHPTANQDYTGPTTMFNPEVVLPQGGIANLAYGDVESLAESLFGNIQSRYQELGNIPVEKATLRIASQIAEYQSFFFSNGCSGDFITFFKANVKDLQGFHDQVKSEAEKLCQRPGFEGCELPLRVLLTRYEFRDNVPLNPPLEEVFSLEKHLAREEELLKQYRA